MSTTEPDLTLPPAPFPVVDEPPGAWTAVVGRLDRRRRHRRLAAVGASVAVIAAAAGVVAVVDRTPQPTEVAATRVEVGGRVALRSLPPGWELVDRKPQVRDDSSPIRMTSMTVQLRTDAGFRVNVRADEFADGDGRFGDNPGEPLPANARRVEVRGHPAARTDQTFELPPGSTRRSVHFSWAEDLLLSMSVSAFDDTGASEHAVLERAATELIDRLEVLPLAGPLRRQGPATSSGSTASADIGGPSGPLPSTPNVPVVATAVNNRREIRVVYYPSRLPKGGRELGCLALLAERGGERFCQDLPKIGNGLFGTVSRSPFGDNEPDVVWGFAPAGTAAVEITLGVDTQEFTAFRHASLPDAGVFWIAQRTGAFPAAVSNEGLKVEAFDASGTGIATQVLRPQ